VEDAVTSISVFSGKDTIAAGAKINYTHVPGQIAMPGLRSSFSLQRRDYRCPNAKGNEWRLSAAELYIDEYGGE